MRESVVHFVKFANFCRNFKSMLAVLQALSMGQTISRPPSSILPSQLYRRTHVAMVWQNRKIGTTTQATLWKMNIMGVYGDQLFIAEGSQLLVFDLKQKSIAEPSHRLDLNNNNIRIGILDGNIPVLITVDEGGEVRVLFVEDLQRSPVALSISSSSAFVAVSSNNHNITLWKIGTETPPKIELTGHLHNVPCIDISPNGRFMVSVSIDCDARVWNIRSGTTVAKCNLREWGWSCKWISAQSVKDVSAPQHVWQSVRESLRQLFPAPRIVDDVEDINGEEDEDEEEYVEQDDDSTMPDADTPMQRMEEDTPARTSTASTDGKMEEETTRIEDRDESGEPSHKKKRTVIKPPEDYLILMGTFHHLVLCSSTLKPLATLYNAIASAPIALPAWLRHMERLSLLEYIPELSLAVVGSQGCARVLLVRILRNADTGEYKLLPEVSLPPTPIPFPISGMCVTAHKQPGKYDSLSYWRLYILYQNCSLFCYDLRMGFEGDNLDVANKVL